MIEVVGLTKKYGSTTAVNDLSFTVRPGIVTGFLGPNGAGKSTTMRMILGLETPSSGRALVDGKPYAALDRPLTKVGALLDEALDVHKADLFCNQVEYHPFLSQARLLERMARADMLLVAYLPIARGAVADVPLLQQIAARHGKTPAQVTLRWLVQQDRVAAIPRSSRPARQAENLDIFDFALSGDEMAAIHGLAEGRRYCDYDFAPDWDD